MLKNELFNPQDPSNVETDHLTEELGQIVASTLLREFTDKKKATHDHLSMLHGKLSWVMASNDEKLAGLGLHVNNNVSESVFGGLTENITKYSMIRLAHAGAMSQSKRNGDFTKELGHGRRKKSDLGLYSYFIYYATSNIHLFLQCDLQKLNYQVTFISCHFKHIIQ